MIKFFYGSFIYLILNLIFLKIKEKQIENIPKNAFCYLVFAKRRKIESGGAYSSQIFFVQSQLQFNYMTFSLKERQKNRQRNEQIDQKRKKIFVKYIN